MLNEKLDKLIEENKTVFCFDIDGTLTTDFKIPPSPNKEMIDILNNLYLRGDYIILYTARNCLNNKEITEKWLEKHEVKYHELYFGKPKAHIYIDDCAVNSEEYIKNYSFFNYKFKEKGNLIHKLIKENPKNGKQK